ncbi:hypothetical protein BGW39_000045 [Mortierella sp. 14UC]|nr:hypothetical protein BGW39_000045 [Mortierella sp. 14UC]
MRSIPEGVEELRLYQWDGKCFGGESRISRWPECVHIDDFTDFQDDYARMRATATVDAAVTIAESRNTVSTPKSTLTATPGSHSDILPNIKKLTLEHSVLDGAGVDRLWSWFPYLESLALYGSSILNVFEFTKLLRARCPLLSGLHISSISNKSMGAFPGLGYAVVLCASLRGWKTLTLSSDALINTSAFWQTSVLHHVDTLETLYLEGFEMADWGSIVGHILDTAPRLKRLYIMPTRIHGMVWQPTKLSETLNWACQDLEVLRIRYSFVGRNSDRRTKHDQFQQQLYHQLGRLTKLKELILGDMEDDEFVFDEDDCDDYDSHDAPSSSSEEDVWHDYDFEDEPASSSSKEEHTQNRYRTTRRTIPQPKFLPESLACPEMTLASGMGALKDLKQLRRVGLRNLEHHGFLASEEDRGWVKENWPLFHQGYRNDVWKSFRRW